ncbi:hypothetical protein TR51_16135 [Kitasatospora griseola]|uniref:Uncharacterized protein n=1 Tax=Kitasatospora griseola TaxID=2064 RepID=A0A0D0PS73_KITGR|nr:hypothetical protein TR51_16135 [Kitasatospora griseola]
MYFGTDEDAQHLTGCPDRYLRQLDCQYDQHRAISALLHVDSRTGSERAARNKWASSYGPMCTAVYS